MVVVLLELFFRSRRFRVLGARISGRLIEIFVARLSRYGYDDVECGVAEAIRKAPLAP